MLKENIKYFIKKWEKYILKENLLEILLNLSFLSNEIIIYFLKVWVFLRDVMII